MGLTYFEGNNTLAEFLVKIYFKSKEDHMKRFQNLLTDYFTGF